MKLRLRLYSTRVALRGNPQTRLPDSSAPLKTVWMWFVNPGIYAPLNTIPRIIS
jgi:hypothetical protein